MTKGDIVVWSYNGRRQTGVIESLGDSGRVAYIWPIGLRCPRPLAKLAADLVHACTGPELNQWLAGQARQRLLEQIAR